MSNELFEDEPDQPDRRQPGDRPDQAPYRVIARRYRPSTFDDVIGQEHVTRTLKNAIREDRLGHAYLFSGPRGIGKTSTARILARAVNCEEGVSPEPCNECSVCQELEVESTPDIIEIDAASQRGIDDIRNLRETVRYSPLQCNYRFYIIDEAHMLSRDAFNAFLKTLEEPPDHVIFVFATTEPEKMPETIRSRCQQFSFRRISHSDMLERLREIAGNENLDVSPQILSDICRASDGALRDAQSLLDQLISIADGPIDETELKLVLGTVSTALVHRILQGVHEGNARAVLNELHEIYHGGADVDVFMNQFLGHLRNLMIIQKCGRDTDLVQGTEEERDEFARQAEWFGPRDVSQMVEELVKIRNRTEDPFQSRLLLESVFVRLCESFGEGNGHSGAFETGSVTERDAPESLADESDSYGEQETPSPDQDEEKAPDETGDAEEEEPGEPEPEDREPEAEQEPEPEGPEAPETSDKEENPEEDEDRPEQKEDEEKEDPAGGDLWNQMIGQLRVDHPTIAALLGEGDPVEMSEEKIEVHFAEPFSFHREKLEQENGTHIIKEVVEDLMDASPDVEFSGAGEAETASDEEEEDRDSPRERAREDPDVEKAREFFNADIVNVEDDNNESG